MAEEEDWIIGKKSILEEIKVTDWDAVLGMKRKDNTMPVGKVGGCWRTKRSLLKKWMEDKLTAEIGA